MEVNMKTIKSILLLAILTISIASIANGQVKPWDVPAKNKDMKSAVTTSPSSVQAGEASYKKNCASCHGKTGLGDGTKAKTLDTSPGDFSASAFQGQTDGSLFYKIKTGRGDMPKYDKKIEDSDIWNIINYLRTFKK